MDKLFPTSSPLTLRCPKCPMHLISTNEIFVSETIPNILPNFIHQLQCSRCRVQWYICAICQKMRKHMKFSKQLSRHLTAFHKSNQDNNMFLSQRFNTVSSVEPIAKPTSIIKNLKFGTEQETQYHTWNREDLGNNYLVAKAHYGTSLEEIIRPMDKYDVSMNMDIAAFLGTLSRHQQKKFAKILCELKENRLKREIETKVDNGRVVCQWRYTDVPETFKKMRNVYLDGANALLRNVPYPKATKLDQHHSYLSIKHMIRHFLALGVNFHDLYANENTLTQHVNTCTSIYNSRSVSNLIEKVHDMYKDEKDHEIILLLGFEFSDDFDPNSSIKSNRQSVWMKSLTVSPIMTNMHSMCTTFPVAFGLKDKDHSVVEEKMLNELEEMRSPNVENLFYCKIRDRMVRVHFEIIISLQDQPERRSCSGLMLGSSTYSARWGYSCNFTEIKNLLVSCQKCMKQLLRKDVVTTCSKCTNWELIGTGCRKLQYKPHHNYPEQSSYLNSNQNIIP